jgi:hypothetical protein
MKLEKPEVRLSGTDGNVFALMGLCSQALKRNRQYEKAMEMCHKITTKAKSYDEALSIMSEYCEVS